MLLLLLPSYKLLSCRVSTCVYIYVKYVQVPFLLHESHVEYSTLSKVLYHITHNYWVYTYYCYP